MSVETLLALLLLISAPIAGSFLGVIVDRVPRGESIVAPRSACRACGTALKPHHLIPILSFALQKGRCARCHAPLPGWLLYLEITTTGLAVLAMVRGGSATEILLVAIILWVLAALALADLLWFVLPDLLTGALFGLAMLLALEHGRLIPAIKGAGLGVAVFLALRWGYKWLRGRQGLGLGDVKLMAGLGALVGVWTLPVLLLLASSTALAVALVHKDRSATRPLPFGAALAAAGGVLVLFVAPPI